MLLTMMLHWRKKLRTNLIREETKFTAQYHRKFRNLCQRKRSEILTKSKEGGWLLLIRCFLRASQN